MLRSRDSVCFRGKIVLMSRVAIASWYAASLRFSCRFIAPSVAHAHGAGRCTLRQLPLPSICLTRGFCPDFASHAEETGAALKRARATLPEGCPIFLLGESMGGLCALQHLILEEASSVDGVILCGALLQVAPGVLPPRASCKPFPGNFKYFPC